MREEERVRQRPDAARDRRDRRRDPSAGLEFDVADDRPVDDVDSDVDDDDAPAEHVAADEAGVARCDDEDLGVLDVAGQVARARVADGDRGVLADEEEGGGHADDRRPADDDRPLALDLDGGPPEDLDRGMGRRRQEPVVAEAQETGVQRVDPVDVLGGVDRVDHAPQADRRRQWHLDDDPVDRRVVVERPDRVHQRRLRRLAVDLDEPAVDPDLLAAPQDLVEIDHRRRVAPADDHREHGRPAMSVTICGDIFADRLADLGCDRAPLEESGASAWHADQAFMPGWDPVTRRSGPARGRWPRSPRSSRGVA